MRLDGGPLDPSNLPEDWPSDVQAEVSHDLPTDSYAVRLTKTAGDRRVATIMMVTHQELVRAKDAMLVLQDAARAALRSLKRFEVHYNLQVQMRYVHFTFPGHDDTEVCAGRFAPIKPESPVR